MSIKIVLRKRENADGTRPLVLKIFKNGKPSIVTLGYNIHMEYWDADKQKVKKSHPNSTRLNNFLAAKLAEASDKALSLETEKEPVTAKAIRQKLKPTGGATFFAQAEIYLADLFKAGNYNVYNADKPRVKRCREFLNGSDIAFSDIDVALIKKFMLYLRTCHTLAPKKQAKKPTKPKKPMAERTITNHLIVIRTIINDAIEGKIYDGKSYPFGKNGVSLVFPDSLKIGLSSEELRAVEQIDLSDLPKEDHARNVWLVSFYFAGVRTGDVLLLKKTDFQNDRLFYSMNKNSKPDSLKIPEKALAIINRYKQQSYKHGLLFPELECVDDLNNQYEVERKTSYADKNLNTYLKRIAAKLGITKPLTMHIARHTFGNLAGDKIPLPVLQKLYRHSKITTTAIYQQNHIHKDIDAALDAVIG